MTSGGRSRLDDLLVRVHRVEGEVVGEVFIREPSGADLVKIARLQAALASAGVNSTPSYLALPLLLCEDASGKPLFPDFDSGLQYIERLQAPALAELTALALKASGLDQLTVEAAEKKSSASPTSTSPTDSPAT